MHASLLSTLSPMSCYNPASSVLHIVNRCGLAVPIVVVVVCRLIVLDRADRGVAQPHGDGPGVGVILDLSAGIEAGR
jgi:hypothetical protein